MRSGQEVMWKWAAHVACDSQEGGLGLSKGAPEVKEARTQGCKFNHVEFFPRTHKDSQGLSSCPLCFTLLSPEVGVRALQGGKNQMKQLLWQALVQNTVLCSSVALGLQLSVVHRSPPKSPKVRHELHSHEMIPSKFGP